MRALARRTEHPFMKVCLANDDSARPFETVDNKGVAIGHVVCEDLGSGRRHCAGDVNIVLDRHCHAGKETAPFAASLSIINLSSGIASSIRQHRQNRLSFRIPGIDGSLIFVQQRACGAESGCVSQCASPSMPTTKPSARRQRPYLGLVENECYCRLA